ncbi:hypothetical protein OIU74_016978 [Salix koriyanagi]|uniref:Uncharacterized protein n=1 Tax=Salix koriyanagi TaxID=2511006 RepID=A0A9Q0PHK5_9ROSI|nr:hypothetical protein OIU74_016978 [Salix koriyanagi]
MKGKDWSFYKVCNSNNDEGQNRKTLSFPNQTRRSSIFSQKPSPFSDPNSPLATASGTSSAIFRYLRDRQLLRLWEKKCEALRNEGAALASWNRQHSFHYNRAPDLGNGQLCQVYQGERPVNGVSSLGAWWMGPGTIVPCDVNPHPVIVLLGSHNKPKVSLMALQLAGSHSSTFLGSTNGWRKCTCRSSSSVEATQENQLNILVTPISSRPGLEMEKRGHIVKSDCDANWLPNFGRVWHPKGI